jgi:hypothetical protein
MRQKTIARFVIAAALSAVVSWPAAAAKHDRPKPTGACAQPSNRCISDCDGLNWCTVYTCVNGQSTPMPLWRCFQPSGLCLAPHC